MMEVWNKLKQPPDWAVKKITGGRLNGKTDISPMWRLQAMTETFGPCGIGWKYELVDRFTVDASEGQKMIFVQINLFIKDEKKWSEPIPGFGGDMLVVKELKGLHSNDEALKMAITDALGNAMKNLGMAATVYANGIDGTKYNRQNSAVNHLASTNTQPNQNNANLTAKPAESKQVLFKAKKENEDGTVGFEFVTVDKLSPSQLKWYATLSKDITLRTAAQEYIKANFPSES